jgi:hypothetical protein
VLTLLLFILTVMMMKMSPPLQLQSTTCWGSNVNGIQPNSTSRKVPLVNQGLHVVAMVVDLDVAVAVAVAVAVDVTVDVGVDKVLVVVVVILVTVAS